MNVKNRERIGYLLAALVLSGLILSGVIILK